MEGCKISVTDVAELAMQTLTVLMSREGGEWPGMVSGLELPQCAMSRILTKGDQHSNESSREGTRVRHQQREISTVMSQSEGQLTNRDNRGGGSLQTVGPISPAKA